MTTVWSEDGDITQAIATDPPPPRTKKVVERADLAAPQLETGVDIPAE
jgi:hypothetical protein